MLLGEFGQWLWLSLFFRPVAPFGDFLPCLPVMSTVNGLFLVQGNFWVVFWGARFSPNHYHLHIGALAMPASQGGILMRFDVFDFPS